MGELPPHPLPLAAISGGRSPGWDEGDLGATDSGPGFLKGLGTELEHPGGPLTLAADNCSHSTPPCPVQMLGHHQLLIVVDHTGPHPHLHLGKASSHHTEMGKLRPSLGSQLTLGHTGDSRQGQNRNIGFPVPAGLSPSLSPSVPPLG